MSLIEFKLDITYPPTDKSIYNNLEYKLFTILNNPKYLKINHGNLDNLLIDIDNEINSFFNDPYNSSLITAINQEQIIQDYQQLRKTTIYINQISDYNYYNIILYYSLIRLYYGSNKMLGLISNIIRSQKAQHFIESYTDKDDDTIMDIYIMNILIRNGNANIKKFDIINIARNATMQTFFHNILDYVRHGKQIKLIDELKKSNIIKFLFVNYLTQNNYDFNQIKL
jgi:nitrogenase subunit NifH